MNKAQQLFRYSAALVSVAALFPLATWAQTSVVTCPNPGERLTVASDPVVQNGQLPIGYCYNPNTVGINQTSEEAKQFLISRYTPGNCSSVGLSNPKVDGINKLDSKFAINLAAMLKAAPMQINIISAFRTAQGQQCANPKVQNSNHSKGCAVDLAYSQKDCSSAACQWVKANAGKFNLQLRMQYDPEWNHLEPVSCNGTSLGPVSTSGSGSSGTEDAPASQTSTQNPTTSLLTNFLKGFLGAQQTQSSSGGSTQAAPTTATPVTTATPITTSANTSLNSNTFGTSITSPYVDPTSAFTTTLSPLSTLQSSLVSTTSPSAILQSLISNTGLSTTSGSITLTSVGNGNATNVAQQTIGTSIGGAFSTNSQNLGTGQDTQDTSNAGQNPQQIVQTLVNGTSSVPGAQATPSQTFGSGQSVAYLPGQTSPSSSPFMEFLAKLKALLLQLLAYLRLYTAQH